MIFDFRVEASRMAMVQWRHSQTGKIVFTNGCFDLLHPGHAHYLTAARSEGDLLVVGVNTDDSVRINKGPGRPVTPEEARAELLLALKSVDAVVLFEEQTPRELIVALAPDVLVKGDEYRRDQIIGADEVEAAGGRVVRVPMRSGFSTTALLAKTAEDSAQPLATDRAVCVIPARFSASRLPGKPLAMIGNKPLISWVVAACQQAETLTDVIVATDDERILAAVNQSGGRAVMTSEGCRSGTDRVMEVSISTPGDLFVNVQGDEPLIPPQLIDQLVEVARERPELDIVTAACVIMDEAEYHDPNVVKVVCDHQDRALYFSRAPIPSDRDGKFAGGLRHIGIYLYRRKVLADFARLPESPLEAREKLEQLRALEQGMTIGVIRTEYRPVGVDTPADLEEVRRILEENV